MKIHTTNYINTFIAVAEDCPIMAAEVPPVKADAKTIANLQFEMIYETPYKYTSDDVVFGVYATRNAIAKPRLKEERTEFFSKGQPCLRSSPLAKRYGWGIHHNDKGYIALYAAEGNEYKRLAADVNIVQKRAMASKRV